MLMSRGYRPNSKRIDMFVVFLKTVNNCFRTDIWKFSNLFLSNRLFILLSILSESAQASRA